MASASDGAGKCCQRFNVRLKQVAGAFTGNGSLELLVHVVAKACAEPVDALVNSTNANLRFGSGVASAIHTAAMPELEQDCYRHSPIALGEAIVPPSFELPNLFVIHTRAASFINDDHPREIPRPCRCSDSPCGQRNRDQINDHARGRN
ncbi:MAG: hypothetical protein B7Z60_05860 [Ferrovum sp. 37-45-19]|nr:MAG: hypothetical protein B7Z65_06015 [Ferrovum sp. 21-44-67]OYV94253.1 MAG: hypothetical protein B7Z60_05860 [Ferrovum sp. 37-45-19]OZB31715.1 MAG: hypothetical protein B7X47_08660 [Ferrovum sp. 34-44-207]